ncbi:MAG: putative drug exporter of the superfamily [Mycobacterium sp.]|jgi:RND superfamily putative drug exporter|nr:putative drug exporter of the superfamily [Mycobacterium sp.]
MINEQTSTKGTQPPFVPRTIHRLAVPIILGWLAIVVLVSTSVPPLEQVATQRQVSLSPKDAPSVQAMERMGAKFKESDSDSFAMLVLESDRRLGDDAHVYYNSLIKQLRADPAHVQHIQDFWGDPLTAPGAQSTDGKAVYVQINLAGNQGTTLGDDSIKAVRDIVNRTPAPKGVTPYVTGPAAMVADMHHSGDSSLVKITVVTLLVIFTMLLLVYRSVITVVLLLIMVGIELTAARGIVAFLGYHELIGLSTFAVNLLVSLGIAAGTDYGIFFFGRYQEARQAGEDRETAFYTTYHGVAHVVLASGLTIAGATFCLSFCRMPYFQTIGVPCAVGMLVAVAVATTLVPAVIAVGGRFGLFDPKRKIRVYGWRRVGTAIVRWPLPILAAACGIALIGLLTLPGYKTSYNDRLYLPHNINANAGYDAAERHFSQARLMPEVMLVEADHDMRDPTDFLVLDKLAKGIFRVPGISRVQAITRPQGTAMEHTSIPFQLSMQNAGQVQTMKFQKARMDDMLKQADELEVTMNRMRHMYGLMQKLTTTTHKMVGETKEMQAVTEELRDDIANFEDTWRPVRSYFYWEKHCYDIPICFSLRSVFDAVDGVDEIDEKFQILTKDFDQLDSLMPQMIAEFPPMIDSMESMRKMMLTMHSTMSGIFGQMDDLSNNATAMGHAFDGAKNDDSFYLPPEVFKNPDFKRALNNFFSPDGKAVRLIISHRGDPATPEGLARIDSIRQAAEESLKGTPLEDAKIYLAGTAATFKDWQDGAKYDLMIAGIGSLCLIFIIMLIITRSLIAALVIVGTVAISLGASFGMSVLVWQYLLGIKLHWMVLAMSVIVLLAVGSDYNLLLVSRFKEEIHAGLRTGIIRAMGGTGKVVTSAGLVFAFTMGSMVVSDLRIIGQIGTTIGLGLLFDTLVVRAFMTPSIAALLGRWFWWPIRVRPRPASTMLRSNGPRPLVRSLLGEGEDANTAPLPKSTSR